MSSKIAKQMIAMINNEDDFAFVVLDLTSSPPFRVGIPTVVFQLPRWVRVADRLTAQFTWHALRASPALI